MATTLVLNPLLLDKLIIQSEKGLFFSSSVFLFLGMTILWLKTARARHGLTNYVNTHLLFY
jgi:hypothetical protein